MEKLSRVTPAVLDVLRALLGQSGYVYAYVLAEQAERPTGTLYVILSRLVRAGWAESYQEDASNQVSGRPLRRFYRLTPEGESAARSVLAERGWSAGSDR